MGSNERASGTGVVLVTLAIAALLDVIPISATLDWVRPDWMLLVLLYWVLVLPHRFGVLAAFALGLYHDVLVGTTLGQWALAYAVAAYFMLIVYQRMRAYVALQQILVIFLLVGSANLLAFLVQQSVGHTLYPAYTILYPTAVSALLWRPVCAALRWCQHRFLVR